MPAILIPVLWVGGAVVLLGGGWYVIGHGSLSVGRVVLDAPLQR